MSSTNIGPTIVLDTGATSSVFAVAFHPDGIHLLIGSYGGIQRWRLVDGREVGKQTGMQLYAISASRDHKWVVCGTASGASVCDAGLHEKLIDVEGTHEVAAVDVSPDSARFATGTDEFTVSVWSILSGERLVGPLKHDREVTGVKFSPNGEHIATARYDDSDIRVFDSHSGDELININTTTPSVRINTPLAWSNDGRQIFIVSNDDKIKCFEVSTGSQLAESQILDDDDDSGEVESIALSTNKKPFIATYAGRTISLLDASTLARIGPVIEDSAKIYSIALSPDSNYLATGQFGGTINVWNLGDILPDLYGPFSPYADKERHPDEQPSTSHDNKQSTSGKPGKTSSLQPEVHSEDGDGGLLEAEVPSNTPAPEFDYGESLSPASSADLREDEPPPLGASHAVPNSSAAPSLASPVDTRAEENDNGNTVTSSHGFLMLKRWLPTRFGKGKKDPALHEPDRVPGELPLPAQHRPRSQSPARVEATNEGPSWMAATKRVPRAVSKPVVNRKRKSPAKPTHSNTGASRRGRGAAGVAGAGQAQQVHDESQPSAGMIRVMDQRESGYSTISIKLPSWMLCRGSAAEDGTHSR